jgi:hypothetical protein
MDAELYIIGVFCAVALAFVVFMGFDLKVWKGYIKAKLTDNPYHKAFVFVGCLCDKALPRMKLAIN